MGEIDMPDDDESLTVSSMSQTPFQMSSANMSQYYQSNSNQSNTPTPTAKPHQLTQKNPLTHCVVTTSISDALKSAYEHHSTEHELTTLGRSDLEGTHNQSAGAGTTGSMNKMLMLARGHPIPDIGSGTMKGLNLYNEDSDSD